MYRRGALLDVSADVGRPPARRRPRPAQDPHTGRPLSEAELAPQVAAFLVAGFESTANSVSWALYEIARHPEVQAKLAAELAGAGLAWRGDAAPGRPLQLSDLAALPYLDLVWKEALRLHPVGSVGPIRQAATDVQLRSGARIPAGTVLWLSVIALHTSRQNFADPERFWPERWQQQRETGAAGDADAASEGDANNAAAAASPAAAAAAAAAGASAAGGGCPFAAAGRPTPAGNSAAPQRSFMPFSHGPRDCLGQVRSQQLQQRSRCFEQSLRMQAQDPA